MHELSIVLNIIDIVEKEAMKAEALSVNGITLEIGQLSTIEPSAFDLAWKQAIKSTLLQNAELDVQYIPGKASCLDCGETFSVKELYDPCPKCGSNRSDITAGKTPIEDIAPGLDRLGIILPYR
jgi:hydrogenase nickel incorporation protein HypA/HybF